MSTREILLQKGFMGSLGERSEQIQQERKPWKEAGKNKLGHKRESGKSRPSQGEHNPFGARFTLNRKRQLRKKNWSKQNKKAKSIVMEGSIRQKNKRLQKKNSGSNHVGAASLPARKSGAERESHQRLRGSKLIPKKNSAKAWLKKVQRKGGVSNSTAQAKKKRCKKEAKGYGGLAIEEILSAEGVDRNS